MSELPKPKVLESQIAHVEQRDWGWFAKLKTPNLKDFPGGLFLSNDGTISLSGSLIYPDPNVQQLFSETISLMDSHRIERVQPDPMLQVIETLLSNVTSEQKINLNDEKISIGDPLVVWSKSSANQPENANNVAYIGKVESLIPDPLAIGFSLMNPEHYVPLNFAKPAWRVDFKHYSPNEQHVFGLHDWRYQFPVILLDSDTNNWQPDVYRLNDELLEELNRESTPLAIPQQEHPDIIKRRGAFVF
jgi:hypothetical protein